MKTSAIYVRVSRDEQANGYSLPTQLEACRQLASNKGYIVVREFVEDFTGTVLDRPELDKLRDIARQGAFEVLIVHDIDRLARSMVHQLMIDDEMKHLGVATEYVLANYDDTPEGRFQMQIRAAVAELEREKIMERNKRGKKGRAKAGHINPGGGGRYGFVYRSEPHKGWFEIDPDAAEVVRTIYRWYIEGDETGRKLGVPSIARKLTQMGVPSPDDDTRRYKRRARGSWTTNTVRVILTEEIYCGTWWYNRRDGKTFRPREEWISVPVPAIVSRETWEAARRQAKINTKESPRNIKHEYLMRFRLHCPSCGMAFHAYSTVQDGIERRYYRCGGQIAQNSEDHTTIRCHGYLRAEMVDASVWEYVRSRLREPDRIQENIQDRRDDVSARLTLLQERIDGNRRRMDKFIAERDRLIDLFADEQIPRDVLTGKIAEKNDLIKKHVTENESLEAQLHNTHLDPKSVELVEQLIATVQDKLDGDKLSFATKRAIIETLDVSGVIFRGETRKDDMIEISSFLPSTTLVIDSGSPKC